LTAAVRTAVSDPEVMLRLAERPADVVLADTAVTRPDSVGFTRRVLDRAPGAAILFFGMEEPGMASATIAAGARGLIQGGDHDLVSVVAKAMLLLAAPGRPVQTTGRAGTGRDGSGRDGARRAGATGATGLAFPAEIPVAGRTAGEQRSGAASRFPGAAQGAGAKPDAGIETAAGGAGGRGGTGGHPGQSAGQAGETSGQPGGAGGQSGGPTVVPVQRGEDAPADAEPHAPNGEPLFPGAPDPRANVAPDVRFGGPRRADPAGAGGNLRGGRGSNGASRQVALTEREMQVLLGMAEGKSNAEIGRELFVSEDTVKTHARRLFRKLGARDRAHAVAAGFRAGLVA
jgi:DNA-binding NarL/FixJ family response regulator